MGVNAHTIQLYWRQVRRHKLTFFVPLIVIPLSALLLDTLVPYFLSQVIDDLTNHNQAAIGSGLVITTVIGVAGVGFNLLGYQLLAKHESNVTAGLAADTFERLINKDHNFFVNEKVGALTSRFIDFIRNYIVLQDLLILRTLGFLLSLVIGLAIVARESWLLAGIVAALIAIILVHTRWGLKVRAPYRTKRKTMVGEMHGGVADAITNNLIVKTFANEKFETRDVSTRYDKFRRVYLKDVGLQSYIGTMRVGIMLVAQLLSMGVCVMLVLNGQMGLAVAVFVLTYMQRLSAQLFALGEMVNGYDQALLEASPMSEILMRQTVVSDKPGARALGAITPTVDLQNVSYHYADGSQDVLHNINLRIQPGEKIGLVGHSGAGKTTITHLLLRFADVTNGSIQIGGQDVRDVTQESLRQNIAYVPQEPMLFHRTLRENIAYGRPKATDAQIRQAAKQANAMEFIADLPNGLDTLVGERGVKLSGGQRQRVAIARAILKDAPILVLDEATSALDSHSERLIQEALQKLMAGRTAIVIAHRLSTIAKMDRIVVLKDGRIAEQGTHKELLAKNKIYAGLWAHQSGGFIEE